MSSPGTQSTTDPRVPTTLCLVGLSSLIAWHYCLWFVPQTFYTMSLLDDYITAGWFSYLLACVATLLIISVTLRRRGSLLSHRPIVWASIAISAAGTLALGLWPGGALLVPFCLVSALAGTSAALLWLLWGERIATTLTAIPMRSSALVFGITLLVSLAFANLLPKPLATGFVALLPLVSGGILLQTTLTRGRTDTARPLLLPETTARQGIHSTVVVCVISLFASIAAYFLVTIIPWETLPGGESVFTLGVATGAVLMLVIALAATGAPGRFNAFRLQPFLLVLLVIAFALYLVGEPFVLPAYLLALAVSSIFELLLAVYLATLILKGYIAPILGFGLSAGCIRLGVVLGNALSLLYERSPLLEYALSTATVLAFICLLAVLLIPLVRQEYQINALTQERENASDLDLVCAAVTREFDLSEREADVVRLLARGYSSSNIAGRLLVSTNTVNTHIRHIYEKLGIHKRSELLEYINRQ